MYTKDTSYQKAQLSLAMCGTGLSISSGLYIIISQPGLSHTILKFTLSLTSSNQSVFSRMVSLIQRSGILVLMYSGLGAGQFFLAALDLQVGSSPDHVGRICPGRYFALNAIYSVVSNVLACFSIEPPLDGSKHEPKMSSGIISYVVIPGLLNGSCLTICEMQIPRAF